MEYKVTGTLTIFATVLIFGLSVHVLKEKKNEISGLELCFLIEFNSFRHIFANSDASNLRSNYLTDLCTGNSLMPSKRFKQINKKPKEFYGKVKIRKEDK